MSMFEPIRQRFGLTGEQRFRFGSFLLAFVYACGLYLGCKQGLSGSIFRVYSSLSSGSVLLLSVFQFIGLWLLPRRDVYLVCGILTVFLWPFLLWDIESADGAVFYNFNTLVWIVGSLECLRELLKYYISVERMMRGKTACYFLWNGVYWVFFGCTFLPIILILSEPLFNDFNVLGIMRFTDLYRLVFEYPYFICIYIALMVCFGWLALQGFLQALSSDPANASTSSDISLEALDAGCDASNPCTSIPVVLERIECDMDSSSDLAVQEDNRTGESSKELKENGDDIDDGVGRVQ